MRRLIFTTIKEGKINKSCVILACHPIYDIRCLEIAYTFCFKRMERFLFTKGEFVWDQSGIRIIGIMQVSVRLAALPIPEYLDFHSGYSAPRSRIAGIYSRIYSYSRIFPNERASSASKNIKIRINILE